jgi:hypothetical protein
LQHVLWIGGPPGTGKTTLAQRLARRRGLRWYGADTRTWQHRDRALRAGVPAAHGWETLTPAERLAAEPSEQLAMSLHVERGSMVVDDLRALPPAPLVVAEGSPVPAAAALDPERALWLLPSPALRAAELERRGTTRVLYEVVGDAIEREAQRHGVPILIVDGSRGIDETVAFAEAHFAAALAAGPRAKTAAERRALLREANESVVEQVRGYYARPWARGDAGSVVRTFVCECGDRSCSESVEVTVAEAAAGPVVAPRHRYDAGTDA